MPEIPRYDPNATLKAGVSYASISGLSGVQSTGRSGVQLLPNPVAYNPFALVYGPVSIRPLR